MAEALTDEQPTPVRSSFFLPMWFMPARKRHALHALYDFCRAVDDAVDEALSPAEAKENLAAWKRELDAIYTGQPLHPVSSAFQHAVRKYGIPRAAMDEMMKGFETDAGGNVVMRDEKALEEYCYRVAGCVGIAALCIFGVDKEKYRNFAITLGHALQLTNILRDLDEDLQQGRCYIPLSELSREGLGVNDTQLEHAPAWNKVASGIALKAQAFFLQTFSSVAPEDVKKLAPALLMRDAYHLLLIRMMKTGVYFAKPEKIRRQGTDVAKLLIQGLRYSF